MSAALKIVDGIQSNSASAASLSSYFSKQCGMKRLPWMAEEFGKLLKKGFEEELLMEIIDRTARAPRPSWAYFSAIIGKCIYHDAFDLVSFFKMPRSSPYHDGLPY